VKPRPIFSCRPKATKGSSWGGLEKIGLGKQACSGQQDKVLEKSYRLSACGRMVEKFRIKEILKRVQNKKKAPA
jgi:hypothetical protein